MEAFMLMAVEKQTLASIDDDILIEKIEETSEVMKKTYLCKKWITLILIYSM